MGHKERIEEGFDSLEKTFGKEVALKIYGDKRHGQFYDDLRNRAAYLYITGQLPTHLRSGFASMLQGLSRGYNRPSSLDGRKGNRKLNEDVAAHFGLEQHPMVMEVREQIADGFVIQPSLGFGTRRGFSKVFMYLPTPSGEIGRRITVHINGSVSRGWPVSE